MHKVKLLLALALLLSLSYTLSVTGVTLRSGQSSDLRGSIMGGTKLYIEGLGFSTEMMANIIYVGDYPCKLEDGATATSMVCHTTAPPVYQEYWNLDIVIIVDGQGSVLAPVKFSYTESNTPNIQTVSPAVSYGGSGTSKLYFNGVHRISNIGADKDMGDIYGLYTGDSLCNRFGIFQDPDQFSPNGLSFLECFQATQQKAGKYLVKQYVFPGYSTSQQSSFKQTLDNTEQYQFVVLPWISQTTNSGLLEGQQLTIQGTGFSLDLKDVNVAVDNVPCQVISSTFTEVKCNLAKKTTETSKLPTNISPAGSQVNGYVSGSGFKYQRYDVSGVSPLTIATFKSKLDTNNMPVGSLQAKSVYGQIRSQNTFGQYYGQVWKGYFVATETGSYKFRGLVDDQFAVYLNKDTYGSASPFVSATPIAFSNSPNAANEYFGNYYQADILTAQSDYIPLEAGKHYYMEVYHINVGGFGKFSLSVEVPNNYTTVINSQTYQVQKITTTMTEDPEILQFKSTGVSSGTINLKVYERSGLTVTVNQNVTISFNANASQFCGKINQFSWFSNYGTTCTVVMYDSDNLITTNKTQAWTMVWTASIARFRSTADKAHAFLPDYTLYSGGAGSFTTRTVQDHSPQMSGTFTADIDGVSIKLKNTTTNLYTVTQIPYNVAAGDLQAGLRQLNGYQSVKVRKNGAGEAGAQWIIYFIGYNLNVNLINVSGAGLLGGSAGTSPQIVASTRRDFTTNFLVDPIDYRWMRTISNKPNVRVQVNGIPSVCDSDCHYDFLTVSPVVSTMTVTGSKVAFTLSNTVGVTSTVNDTTIMIDGKSCIITDKTMPLSSFECQLPINTDSTPKLTAGIYMPSIYVAPLGYLTFDASINPINTPFVVTAPNITSAGVNGGYQVQVTGTGFPEDKNLINFTICSQLSTIDSLSNIQATIWVPACIEGLDSIRADFATFTGSVDFTYVGYSNTVVVTSISPVSWSPVLKGVMNITGTGFGTDATQLKVFLSNATGNIYQMKVLSVSDTLLKVGIPGGLPGDYDVNVIKTGLGNALVNPTTANQFSYEVVIDSITPNTGSYNGGTLLTISGRNFVADALDTMVTIGNQLNQLCRIETITSTEIKCRTPPKNFYYNVSQQLIVVVDSKLMIQTDFTCNVTNCHFNYVSKNDSPLLENISSTAVNPGNNLTLTGQRFDIGGGAIMVSLTNLVSKKVTAVAPVNSSATSITITIPQLESGFYAVRARSDSVGESNGLALNISLVITAPNPNTLSVNGGKLRITGTGFPDTWPNNYYNRLSFSTGSRNLPLTIQSMTTTLIVLNIPQGVSGQTYSFSIQNVIGTTKVIQFSQQTTSTPTVNLISAAAITSGTQTLITLNRTVLSAVVPEIIQIYSTTNPQLIINVATFNSSGTQLTFNVTLNSGKYGFKLYDDLYGWFSTTATSFLSVSKSGIYTIATTQTSFNGGTVTVAGNNVGDGATLKINGLVGTVLSKSNNETVFSVPTLITPVTQSSFKLGKNKTIDLSKTTTFGDSAGWAMAFDSEHSTMYTSNNSNCFVGIDIGVGLGVQLTRVRYFPNPTWNIAYQYIKGGKVEVSNDNTTWTLLATVDQTVHAGWNSFMITNINIFRYVRFSHTSQSKCNLAEFELTGIVMSSVSVPSVTSLVSDVMFDDGVTTQTFTGAVEYREDHTPIITAVTPDKWNVYGNKDITLTGLYLDVGTPTVNVDGIDCVVQSSSATQIVCTLGARLNLPTAVSFSVMIGGIPAITQARFRYVMRWSDPRTWGTDLPPVDDDLVSVPKGMHLLVDQSTPILKGIIVENATIQFADQIDMVVQAEFITLRGGQFIAGSEQYPYQKQLTFIMHGNYYSSQQPMFGNKGIGCLECKFTMYGQRRLKTWTTIAATIDPTFNTLVVSQDVDWRVGEEIVVASTSYDHNEAEQRTIVAISGRTITVDQPFKYSHYSDEQSYTNSNGTDKIEMRAEVGLLTRNIKMMGDDTSVASDYGSHLMLTGSAENGLVGKIAYTEFTKCGQPQIVGRYCHHFHMAGDVPESYSIGNSVHHSMARVLTIHGVHFLYVAWNVGYRVKGHNFFIQDGIETNNVLQYNLAISSLLVNNMMQTDMSVASFWVTNPTNHLRFNHAAGSDFYGFWYEIKEHPDGPSATQDVCPIGNPLGESHDNVAHSNVRFGLRIFKLYSSQNPCDPIRNDQLEDPWSANPSIQSRFYNYVLWKNGQAGLLAQETGNMIFQNFTIAESKKAGLQFYKANFTKENVKAINFVIIGRSYANYPNDDAQLAGAKGVILPRTGIVQLENIRFYNFINTTTIWQACSKCDNLLLYTNFGATYYASKISYVNVLGPYYNMLGLKRQVFHDLDGTLTSAFYNPSPSTALPGTLTFGWPHILQQAAYCGSAADPTLWDSGAFCDNNVTVRQVMFTNLQNQLQFQSQNMKAHQLSDVTQKTNENQTVVTSILSLQKSMEPKKETKFTYSLPFLTGHVYNIWWGTGIDFKHVAMVTSHLYKDTQAAIIFKFNYTANRELFEIAPMRQGKPFNYSLIQSPSGTFLDSATCGNGQYYHDNSDTERTLHLCASGKSRHLFQYTDVNAIYCRYLCPAPPGTCTREKTARYWSNPTSWDGAIAPVEGDNVTIKCEWTMIMDVSPARIKYFEINGNLVIPDTKDITISADYIWIKSGSLIAGQSSAPFTHKLIFQINGLKDALTLTTDPALTANKMFVVTGKLNLYGAPPTTTWTRLTNFADINATTITVGSTAGWVVGDQLGIAPSFSAQTQFEKVTITAISGTTVTFAPALKYNHYGAATATITKAAGTLDMRAGVAHLTRNIQITSGPDAGWGFTLVHYGYISNTTGSDVVVTGKMQLSGVQFIRGGQYDTDKAALQLLNVIQQTQHTVIDKCSFHECQDFCLSANVAFDFEITNNVFFNARKFHVRALTITSFQFSNNLMIGVTKRPTFPAQSDLIACFASWTSVNPTPDKVKVTNNLCQGSEGNGYAVPHVGCADIDIYPFAGNTAGSCAIGWIFARGEGTCLAAKGVYAYASNIGQIHNPASTLTVKFKNFIMADNGRGLTIRIGGDSAQKTGYLMDSYITAIARPTCTKCYGTSATVCTGNHGVRMLTTGANGEQLPLKFGPGYDVVCKAETIDGKVFVNNTQFNNFNLTYGLLPQCSNNVIFKPHSGGSDITGSHHLFNTTCTSCQLEAYAYFPMPPLKQLGWFGGCGSILCTGNNNYYIRDASGTFLPTKGILLANNSWIGDNTPSCTKIAAMNGYYCQDEDFGVLEYQSVAPDFNSRIMWPVYLKFEAGNWTSQTNGWKQWQWNGGQPLNKRMGRFVSVLKLQKMYNMSFVSMPPEDMTLKFQKRMPQGNSSDWAIIKLYYPKPNSIRVEVGGVVIKPTSLFENDGLTPLNTSQCGSNKFFYKNYTVHFVVTGDPNCQVRVSLTNTIQLTARFDMPIDDFFKDDGVTRFINRMCALLQITDTSRVKVVGVYTGSTIVVTHIDPPTIPLDNSTTANASTTNNAINDMQNAVNNIINNGGFAGAMTAQGFGAVSSVGSTIIDGGNGNNGNNGNGNGADSGSSSKNDTGMIIGIVLGATAIVCLAIVGSVCYMRKKAKIGQFTESQQIPIESDSQKQGQTHLKVISSDNFSLVDLKHAKKQLY